MREVLAITKALSDENRVRIFMFLQDGEMCVCQIIEMLGLAPSTVSKHLDILYQAGLVESRKEGLWVFYRLPDKPSDGVRKATKWLISCLANDPQSVEDARRKKTVIKISKEKLCCRYRS